MRRHYYFFILTIAALCCCTTVASEVIDLDGSHTIPDQDESKAWGVAGEQHNNNNNNNKDIDKGENASHSATASTTGEKIPFIPTKDGTKSDDNNNHNTIGGGKSTSSSSTGPSFERGAGVSPSPPHGPPEGFEITARVYTDPDDKKAHFDEDAKVTLPYFECGAVGSTTSPLLVKNALFRHALGGPSVPQAWSGSEYGPHPQLLVPLAKLELTVSSGESRVFQAGDVILLEDVLSDGHKIKTVESGDFEYLLLTLPQHYHHVGKDRVSLVGTTKTKIRNGNPCPIDTDDKSNVPAFIPMQTRRKVAFGCLGAVMGGKLVEVLVKVAPLWLSVGFGGTGLIISTIYGFVHGGEWCYETCDLWLEKRRLAKQAEDIEEELDVVNEKTTMM